MLGTQGPAAGSRGPGESLPALTRTAARYTPIWEPSRPGHLYLDLTGAERLWGPVHDAARRFQKEIRERLGLAGALGVAANKLVSNVASRALPQERWGCSMWHMARKPLLWPR
jgi:hypothetical protein